MFFQKKKINLIIAVTMCFSISASIPCLGIDEGRYVTSVDEFTIEVPNQQQAAQQAPQQAHHQEPQQAPQQRQQAGDDRSPVGKVLDKALEVTHPMSFFGGDTEKNLISGNVQNILCKLIGQLAGKADLGELKEVPQVQELLAAASQGKHALQSKVYEIVTMFTQQATGGVGNEQAVQLASFVFTALEKLGDGVASKTLDTAGNKVLEKTLGVKNVFQSESLDNLVTRLLDGDNIAILAGHLAGISTERFSKLLQKSGPPATEDEVKKIQQLFKHKENLEHLRDYASILGNLQKMRSAVSILRAAARQKTWKEKAEVILRQDNGLVMGVLKLLHQYSNATKLLERNIATAKLANKEKPGELSLPKKALATLLELTSVPNSMVDAITRSTTGKNSHLVSIAETFAHAAYTYSSTKKGTRALSKLCSAIPQLSNFMWFNEKTETIDKEHANHQKIMGGLKWIMPVAIYAARHCKALYTAAKNKQIEPLITALMEEITPAGQTGAMQEQIKQAMQTDGENKFENFVDDSEEEESEEDIEEEKISDEEELNGENTDRNLGLIAG
ncbi:hypothetical protein HOD08_02755 [bacterium]|nr:hypothetical protein [bacterium]